MNSPPTLKLVPIYPNDIPEKNETSPQVEPESTATRPSQPAKKRVVVKAKSAAKGKPVAKGKGQGQAKEEPPTEPVFVVIATLGKKPRCVSCSTLPQALLELQKATDESLKKDVRVYAFQGTQLQIINDHGRPAMIDPRTKQCVTLPPPETIVDDKLLTTGQLFPGDDDEDLGDGGGGEDGFGDGADDFFDFST